MVSSYTVVNPSLGCCALAGSPRFAKLAYSHATFALSQHCRSRSARAVRPASLAASARYSVCRRSPVKVGAVRLGLGMLREQDRWLRPCRFGRSGSVSRHFTQLPVSQRLKPQCSVMEAHSSSKPSTALVKVARVQPWLLVTEVSAFKATRQVVQQPPNPSFKRTRLRRSA